MTYKLTIEVSDLTWLEINYLTNSKPENIGKIIEELIHEKADQILEFEYLDRNPETYTLHLHKWLKCNDDNQYECQVCGMMLEYQAPY